MQYYQYWPVGLHFGAVGSLHLHMVEALAREVHDVYKFIIVLYNSIFTCKCKCTELIYIILHVGCTAISISSVIVGLAYAPRVYMAQDPLLYTE